MTRGATSGGSEGSRAESVRNTNQASGAPTEKKPYSQLLLSVVPEIILLGAAIYLFIVSENFRYVPQPGQPSPSFWPQLLCVGIGVGAIVRIVQKLWVTRRPVDYVASAEGESDLQRSRLALGAALVVGYLVSMLFIGYILATALFLIAFIYLGGQRKWYVVPLGILSSVFFTYIFLKVVYIALPSGVGIFDQFSVFMYKLLGIY